MKFKSFFTFAFLCVCALTNNLAFSTKDTYFNYDIWLINLECTDGTWTNKTKLSDFSEECQSEILQKIDFHGFIDMAMMNNTYLMLATDIFDRKFANKSVFVGSLMEKDKYFVILDGHTTKNVELSSVFFFLERFGEYFSSLSVGFDDQCGDLKKSVELASQFCRNLQSFHVVEGTDVLSDVTKPFHNVTNIEFFSTKFDSHIPNLDFIFPNMQMLKLDRIQIVDSNSFLDYSFPNLVHFSFEVPHDVEGNEIRKLMEKNPQIQWMKIDEMSTQLVKFANEHLPNLEILIIWRLTVDYTDEIHFKHVRVFQYRTLSKGTFGNITFERLEKFHFELSTFPLWFDFVERNPNLRSINMNRYDPVNDTHISLLPKIGRNLVEVSFNIGSEADGQTVRVETIVDILQKSKHLERLYLYCICQYWDKNQCEGIKKYAGTLKTQMGNKWNIEETYGLFVQIFIERK